MIAFTIIETTTHAILPNTYPKIPPFLVLQCLYINDDVRTVASPINKSPNSPTYAVLENGNLIMVLITTIIAPPIGPIANPPKIAGRLENCTSKNDGNKNGNGNLGKKYKIVERAEKIAIFVI